MLLDLGGHGSAQGEPPKFLQSLAALGQEDEEEEQGGEEPKGGQMVSSWTQCSTDSQTSLPKESITACTVPAAPALPEVADPSPKALTVLDAIKNKAATPCPPKQRRFMVYICGGYRGKAHMQFHKRKGNSFSILCVSELFQNSLCVSVIGRMWFMCNSHLA